MISIHMLYQIKEKPYTVWNKTKMLLIGKIYKNIKKMHLFIIFFLINLIAFKLKKFIQKKLLYFINSFSQIKAISIRPEGFMYFRLGKVLTDLGEKEKAIER